MKSRCPFPVLGMGRIERTARCRRRAWIGKPGKDGGFAGGEDGSEDETVYVGRDSTRYHRSRTCHYLANHLVQVSYEQVSGMRNDSGGKYYACRSCGAGAESGGPVYIMPSRDELSYDKKLYGDQCICKGSPAVGGGASWSLLLLFLIRNGQCRICWRHGMEKNMKDGWMFLLYLAIAAGQDLRRKSVELWVYAGFGVCALLSLAYQWLMTDGRSPGGIFLAAYVWDWG